MVRLGLSAYQHAQFDNVKIVPTEQSWWFATRDDSDGVRHPSMPSNHDFYSPGRAIGGGRLETMWGSERDPGAPLLWCDHARVRPPVSDPGPDIPTYTDPNDRHQDAETAEDHRVRHDAVVRLPADPEQLAGLYPCPRHTRSADSTHPHLKRRTARSRRLHAPSSSRSVATRPEPARRKGVRFCRWLTRDALCTVELAAASLPGSGHTLVVSCQAEGFPLAEWVFREPDARHGSAPVAQFIRQPSPITAQTTLGRRRPDLAAPSVG